MARICFRRPPGQACWATAEQLRLAVHGAVAFNSNRCHLISSASRTPAGTFSITRFWRNASPISVQAFSLPVGSSSREFSVSPVAACAGAPCDQGCDLVGDFNSCFGFVAGFGGSTFQLSFSPSSTPSGDGIDLAVVVLGVVFFGSSFALFSAQVFVRLLLNVWPGAPVACRGGNLDFPSCRSQRHLSSTGFSGATFSTNGFCGASFSRSSSW
jgi:hypothetical protein